MLDDTAAAAQRDLALRARPAGLPAAHPLDGSLDAGVQGATKTAGAAHDALRWRGLGWL